MGRRHRIRPYADLPASFYLGNHGGEIDTLCVFRDARAKALLKETLKVGFEPVSRTTPKFIAKVLPTGL